VYIEYKFEEKEQVDESRSEMKINADGIKEVERFKC